MEIYEDFNKKKHINVKQHLIRIHSVCLSPITVMVYIPPLSASVTRKNNTNASATIIVLFVFLRKPKIILVSPATMHSYGTELTFDGSSGCN